MNFIPVNEPLLDGNEKKYLIDCINTGWISSEGGYVTRLEEGMASYVGKKHGIAVCNGSVAIELAIEALKLEKGDEIIMPTFTIISCIAPLIRKGIKPVLIDSCADTWNMDVDQIESKITKNTKAIMVVHIYGIPVDMKQVIEIANNHNLKIIEDAAEAHGLDYRDEKCGSFGDISIMSFYPNKHITTGEGGILFTDNDIYAERCRLFRNLCHKPGKRFVHEELGYNFRMSNIQAAVGVAQLEKISEHLALKMKMGERYTELLGNCNKFQLPVQKTSYAKNIYWVFGIVIKQENKIDAAEFMSLLENRGIGTRPFFYPMHMQPVFKKMGLFQNEKYPVAEWLAQKGFYIPSGLSLKEAEMQYIAEQVLQIAKTL